MATTLGNIIEQIRERADLNSSQFITDTELTTYINYSLGELYGLLINAFGGDYFATSVRRTVSGTELTSPLPDDLYKVLGIDLQLSPYPSNNRITLQPYNFNERNRANAINMSGYATQYATNYRYNIFNQTVQMQPPAVGALELNIWYVPTAPQFTTNTTGVTAPTTAVQLSNGLLKIADPQLFRVGDTINRINSFGNSIAPTWYVIVASPAEIVLSLTSGGPAANLGGFFLEAGGETIVNPNLSYLQTFVNNTNLQNWLEYVIVDVVIKCKAKEETDPSMFVRAKSLLTERIRNEAQNRDIGSPASVSDVYAVGSVTDTGWGGNWVGGGVW